MAGNPSLHVDEIAELFEARRTQREQACTRVVGHQDPGFIDHVVNKKAEIVRVYLPPDANCLLSVMDHCLRSQHCVNVVVAGKHPAPQWLGIDAAVRHCGLGIDAWSWAGNDKGSEPDVVLACAGDGPTLETLTAASILRLYLPDLKLRVVNVVDLMKLQSPSMHPHGWLIQNSIACLPPTSP